MNIVTLNLILTARITVSKYAGHSEETLCQFWLLISRGWLFAHSWGYYFPTFLITHKVVMFQDQLPMPGAPLLCHCTSRLLSFVKQNNAPSYLQLCDSVCIYNIALPL